MKLLFFWILVLALLGITFSCASSGISGEFPKNAKLPRNNKLYIARLYSRGVERKEIATIFLQHEYAGLNSSENYFQAQLVSILRPIQKIQVPPRIVPEPESIILPPEIPPQFTQPELGYLPYTSWSFRKYREQIKRYINIETFISDALFDGTMIYKAKVRQPFERKDRRPIERALFISSPDELGNILSVDFYRFPSKRGYLLRVDLRPAEAFHQRIPVGTPMDKVATILGESQTEALFHNQTLVGKPQFY